MNSKKLVHVTIAATRCLGGVILLLMVLLPRLLVWYQSIRPMGEHASLAVRLAYYACTPAVLHALWCMDRMLRNILEDLVFIPENVTRIRGIRWCCALVCLICIPAAFFYLPLIFLCIIMSFLALVVRVVEHVMAAAVEIREENDLTV